MAQQVIADLVTRWKTEGADQAAASLEKAAAATAKADAAVSKYAADAEKAMAPATDAMVKSQDTFSRKTLATAKSIESLERRIDPVYRSLKDWETAQKKVNLAIEQGTVSQERGEKILAGYEGRYRTIVASSKKITDAVNDNTNAFRLNRIGMMELRAAGINSFQALAAGMAPLQVAMMEGGQVVGAFVQGTEGGLKSAAKAFGRGALGIGASIMSTFGAFPTVAIGATAAIAGLYKGFSILDDWITHTTADSQEFAKWLDKVGQSANTTSGFIDKVSASLKGMSLVDLNKTARGSAEYIRQQQAQLTNPLAQIAGTEGVLNDPKFVQTYRLIDSIIAKLRGDGYTSLEDLHHALDDVVKNRPDLQKYVETWEKLGVAILKAHDAAQQAAHQAELKAHGMGAYQPHDDSAATRYFSQGDLINAQAQQAAALQSINARTVAQRAAAAAAEVEARPINFDQNPNVRLFEISAAKAKVFAQATRQANDALRQTQDALKTAGLQGYAQQVAQINLEIEKQIKLNPENADTWRAVGEAEKQALAIQTRIALFQGQTDNLAILKAEASAIGRSKGYYDDLMTTIQAKIDLERQGISVTSKAGQAYVENARKLSAYTDEIEKQKDAWSEVHDAGSSAIDDLFDGITDRSQSLSDTLKNVVDDIEKTFLDLAVKNPLKNSLFNAGLPTLKDLFSHPTAPRLSTPSIASLGATPATAMWVRNADILPGSPGGGQSGGLIGWVEKMLGIGGGSNAANTDPWKGLRYPSTGTAPLGAANDNLTAAIRSVESGGNYSALGPLLKGGHQALGAYQVMDYNVGPWSKQTLGYAMTPSQFLASPSAQDAIARNILGGYASKYGTTGAMQAWFGGPGNIGRNPSDALGTSMTEYVNKVTAAMGDAANATNKVTSGFTALGRNAVPSLAGATNNAAQGLGSLGNGLSSFGSKLSNWLAPVNQGGGGGIFGSLLGGLGKMVGGISPTSPFWAPNTTLGAFLGMAGGGLVAGPGTGTSDSIPAWLSNGEFIVNAAATRQHLPDLVAMNQNRFASGGLAGNVVPFRRDAPNVTINIENHGQPSEIETTQKRAANGDLTIDAIVRPIVRDETTTSGRKTNRVLQTMGLKPAMVKR